LGVIFYPDRLEVLYTVLNFPLAVSAFFKVEYRSTSFTCPRLNLIKYMTVDKSRGCYRRIMISDIEKTPPAYIQTVFIINSIQKLSYAHHRSLPRIYLFHCLISSDIDIPRIFQYYIISGLLCPPFLSKNLTERYAEGLTSAIYLIV
jgi:hypothetical protein